MKPIRCLGLALLMLSPVTSASNSQLYEVAAGNQTRSYKLFTPNLPPHAQPPLMIVLHGGLGNADETESTTGMNQVAQTHQFLVAYPNGTALKLLPKRRTWNAGNCCGPAAKEQVNDVAFIQTMLNDIAQHHAYDVSRVYVTGISNGAMMAYRLACELPEKIAAIIPVAGTLAIEHCPAAGDIAVLHIHGSQDSNVPYHGGTGENSLAGVKHRSVPNALRIISSARGCAQQAAQSTLSDGSTLSQWSCPNHAPIYLRLVPNGEHVWPGGNSKRNNRLYGGNFSASQAAWEFASRYHKAH